MDPLIIKQNTDAKAIQRLISNFKKDPASRKTTEYCAARLQALNNAWEVFEQRNTEVEQLKSQCPQHKYFEENFFSRVETIYEDARETIENAIRDAIQRTKNTERIEEQLRTIRKQTALIESLQRAIDRLEPEIPKQKSTAFFIQKTKLLNDYWEHIVSNHSEIMSGGKFKDDYFDTDVFTKTEDAYQAVLIKLQEQLDTLTSPQVQKTTERSAEPCNTNPKENHVKLPHIDIPVFDGDYLKWQSFRDLFCELIHKDARMAKAEKLFYLKTNLKGEPNELIRHLSITNENYDTAWGILDKRYNNKRVLVTAQLRTLLNQPELTRETAEGLKKLHDTATECLQAIQNLGIETKHWDALVIFLLTEKLDKETHRLYEQSLKTPRDVQTLEGFLEFIESRFQGLEAIEPSKRYTGYKQLEKKEKNIKIHHGTIARQVCPICRGEHKIYSCDKFLKLSIQGRIDAVRKAKLCLNCITKGHATIDCKSWRVCKTCSKKHHTLLHLTPSIQRPTSSQNTRRETEFIAERTKGNNQPAEITTHIARNHTQRAVLLATAIIQCPDIDGNLHQLRALIDQGAQGTFLTEDAAQNLRLPRNNITATVTGVGESNVGTIRTCVELTIKPRFHSTFSMTTTALVLKKLTKILPSEGIIPHSWKHTRNLVLADPKYGTPGRIDVILGADVVGNILLGNVLRGEPGSPVAQQTELGWILSGEITSIKSEKTIQCFISEVDINKELRKFWESEEIQHDQIITSEDVACENHYRTTHRRAADGRYTVRIPFRENPDESDKLEGSRQLALARLFQMEQKFKTNVAFASMYKNFMKEYILLGHMVPVTDNMRKGYYLPHQAVLKQESTTTKLRVVFDASAKRSNTKSINDLMMVGPQIQQTLLAILLRWRKHKIVFTADIEKMYRQIKIDVRDQDYQRILWRESPKEPILEYNLTTVTYGTASAPYLAIRTLQQLARDDEQIYPIAAKIITSDTYVDDIVSGGNSLDEVIESSDQLIKLLKGGGFNLRKWSSNSRELLQKIPPELREDANNLDLDKEKTIKALGVYWNPSTDKFKIQVNIDHERSPSTSREFLSEAAKIFDPIGLLAPVKIKIKLLFQKIYSQGCNWDEKPSKEIRQTWKRIKIEMPILKQISIPRWIGYTGSACKCELHGFSDASENAYGAAVYLRVRHSKGVSISLVTAKTKVAPLKNKMSLPRLELCGAALLANLIKLARESLNIEDLRCYAWTDSTIVLAWIQEDPHKWKTFVGNRVAEIQAIIDSSNWFHVKSQENPADVASRGLYPSQLKDFKLWWEGPRWLMEERTAFPKELIPYTDQERKQLVVNTTSSESEGVLIWLLQRYSSLGKMQRVLAYCNRFINNIKEIKGLRNVETLSTDEIDKALIQIIKFTQSTHFKEEISRLLNRQEVPKTSRLFTLSPFLDKNELLRVGGRLENSNMSFDQKHPIILPYKCELTTLVISKAHNESQHGGNSLTLELTRQRYWILNGLKATKGFIHQCTKCHRYKAKMSQQMMGMLPTARVIPSPPFTHTGVDYAGPVDLLLAKGRGNRTQKGYIAIFICLTSKAIHIEVVTDLTSKAFIAAFKRFTSRRGPVAHLYSDNATNFVGASKIITDLHKLDSYKADVNTTLQETGTQWHFIPPASPHFGGLWEAGVKSIKYHLRRVIGETKLTYEEMCTLMTQIEACLNSRPLCPLSEDPESLEVLTPGHFIRGSAILTTPDKDVLEANPNLLDRWDRTERMKQEFWKKWSTEYLGRLQHRPKWTQGQNDLRKGNLVLIKDEQMPPSRWALGRIIEVHPGSDGKTRVVTLKTKSGTLKRPITKLSLLPIIDNKARESTELPIPLDEKTTSEPEKPTSHKYAANSIHLKRVSEEPIKTQSAKQRRSDSNPRTSYTRRSYNTNKLAYLCIFAFLFLIALGEETKLPYQITKFHNQEGIYFEDIAEIQLYNSEWNLLIYYDLSTYWREFRGITKLVRQLSELCEEQEHTKVAKQLCSATIVQLKHQILECEHINEVLYQQNENVRTRNKRAPLEIIGTVANKLFGILDQDFADKYETQLENIKMNENLLHELLKNQTSIAENTLNVLKKNHQAVQHQLNAVETQLAALANSFNHSQQDMVVTQTFTSAAVLITISLVNFQHIQRSILSVVTDTRHGRLNTLLLTPSQLHEHLRIIREHLPGNVRLPGNGSATSLLAIYNSMHVRMRITERNVLFDTRIPLLSTESYRLYKLIPIPVLHHHEYIYIQPSTSYLAINRHRDRYTPITQEELAACSRSTNTQLICNLKQPIFTPKSNQSRCELDLLTNQRKISSFCQLRSKQPDKIWIKLNAPGNWIYTMDEETHLDVLCDDATYPISLTASGIIKLQPTCTINHPTLYISANNRVQGQLHSSFIPEGQVISTHLNISSSSQRAVLGPQVIKEVNSLDLNELENAIKIQKQHINSIPRLNVHDLHHYTSVYILIAMVIICGVYFRCRHRNSLTLRRKRNDKPQPAPRHTIQRDDPQDLPSLNLETGECTEYI